MLNLFKKKRVIKGELKALDVELVSLLFDDMKPANGKSTVFKNDDGKTFKEQKFIKKFKADEKGCLYVTVYEPDVKDTQGDFITVSEIEKACANFSKKGMLKKNDINHNLIPENDVFIAENYILKVEDKQHFPNTKVGSWVQVLKFDTKSELWQKVKKGEINGVSLYGTASEVSDIEDIKKAVYDFKTILANERNEEIEDLKGKIIELEGQLNIKDTDSTTKEDTEEVKKTLNEMKDVLSKAISKSIKGEGGEVLKDEKIVINGEQITVKASHKEVYKGFANVDAGKSANILNQGDSSLFIDSVIDSKTNDTLTDISVLPLLKDEKIDIGLVQDLVFKNVSDGALTISDIAGKDISCPTGILNAEFTLARDTVEFYKDKYGEQQFGAYVEAKIAKKAEKALRTLLFKGDRGATTEKLKALNGVIKLATDNNDVTSINSTTYDTWDKQFEQALLSFENDILEDQENFVFYVSHKDLIKIRSDANIKKNNQKGRLVIENGNVYYDNIPVKARFLPDGTIIGGLPKFIILGYRTDAEIKIEHHGSDWKYHWYVRVRPGISYLEGYVKVFNLEV